MEPVDDEARNSAGRKTLGSQSEREVGLCFSCSHARKLTSAKGSDFYRCGKAAEDDSLKAYPPLPVTICPAYSRAASSTEAAATD
jgi:hypothetical protein